MFRKATNIKVIPSENASIKLTQLETVIEMAKTCTKYFHRMWSCEQL